MVDLHCHILSGLDDGPESFEESLAMAEMAIADGVTHLVATPHANSVHRFDYAAVCQRAAELQRAVGSRLQLATGCDFHLSAENLAALKEDAPRFCIHQKMYLLVEFNDFSIPPQLDHVLYRMQLDGLRPIVTHPERNAILRAQSERLEKWIGNGCYAQVTGGSLIGAFGPNAKESAVRWIEQGLVHFVASDAHNTTRRPHKLREAYEAVQKEFGRAKAEALLLENPLAAFEGRALPYVGEVLNEKPKRKRFWLFGR